MGEVLSARDECAGKRRSQREKRYVESLETYVSGLSPRQIRYVILDDHQEEAYEKKPELQKHLVVVNASKGLQAENCIEACKIMNGLEI